MLKPDFGYCPKCGSSSVNRIIPENDTFHRLVCTNCGYINYQNPRLVVGTIPLFESKILLGKRAIEPRSGFWNLPAGFLECGETLQEGAIRETYEETQAIVSILRMHTIYELPEENLIYFFFLAEMESEHFGVTSESLDVNLFSREEIPELAFSSNTFALEAYFANRESNKVHSNIRPSF